jgi:hypothetical protein
MKRLYVVVIAILLFCADRLRHTKFVGLRRIKTLAAWLRSNPSVSPSLPGILPAALFVPSKSSLSQPQT